MRRIAIGVAATVASVFLVSGCSTNSTGETWQYENVHTDNGTVPCVIATSGISCDWDATR